LVVIITIWVNLEHKLN